MKRLWTSMISFCRIITFRADNSNTLNKVINASKWPEGYPKLHFWNRAKIISVTAERD